MLCAKYIPVVLRIIILSTSTEARDVVTHSRISTAYTYLISVWSDYKKIQYFIVSEFSDLEGNSSISKHHSFYLERGTQS